MSTVQHTPGPWFADSQGRIWRRDPSELYENGGGVAGDKPLATVYVGWSGEGKSGYPREANARLIAAAPDLLEALQAAYAALLGYPYRNATTQAAMDKSYAAIAKATGKEA